ncbi:hypothetical protein [Achromobacter mucicolens]|uniref:hypothetical protein n=1 Tax=Achromobacter mucicolens TaxID=1389922 RepID=UPI0021DB7F89|nr:hypothetical protein [Achromobacter mucicolens]
MAARQVAALEVEDSQRGGYGFASADRGERVAMGAVLPKDVHCALPLRVGFAVLRSDSHASKPRKYIMSANWAAERLSEAAYRASCPACSGLMRSPTSFLLVQDFALLDDVDVCLMALHCVLMNNSVILVQKSALVNIRSADKCALR